MRIKEIIYEYKDVDEARLHHYEMMKDGYMHVYHISKLNYLGNPIVEIKYVNKDIKIES